MLKAIGVVKESQKQVEEPYQDSVMAPLDQEDKRDINEEGDGEDGDWEDEDQAGRWDGAPSSAILGKLLLAIGKVCAIYIYCVNYIN